MQRCMVLASTMLCVTAVIPLLHRNLGSKTPYYPQASSYLPAPDNCTPVHLSLVLRHGTRNPGDDEIVGFNALAEKLSRLEGLDPKHDWLKGWKFPFEVEDQNLLLPLGMQEHYALGKRLRSLFPEAFPAYHPNVYSIRGTYKTRAGQSASSFAYGAFEGTGLLGEAGYMPVHMHMDSKKQDVQLRFLDLCEAYQIQVKTNSSAYAEHRNFLQGNEIEAVVKSISAALVGARGSEVQLDAEEVLLAFEACAYDIILADDDQSKWCSLFTTEAVEIVNYALDLKDYIKRGYAHDITRKAAMMLLRDVVSDMDSFITGDSKTQQWRFAHDSTILPFASLIGLFRDPFPLTGKQVEQQRQFRSSKMIPFAANAVFAVYECPEQHVPWRVKLLWNEQEMVIPGCEHETAQEAVYCDFKRFRATFAEIVDEWRFEQVCGGQCACAWEKSECASTSPSDVSVGQ